MRCAIKNNPKISNFDDAFEEIKKVIMEKFTEMMNNGKKKQYI